LYKGKKEHQMSIEHNQTAFQQVITEAFNKGNYDVLSDYFHPNFIEHQFGLHPTIEGFK
jgi:hypothetical protein